MLLLTTFCVRTVFATDYDRYVHDFVPSLFLFAHGSLVCCDAAHRRARKLVGVLEEITSAVEEAFADAASKGRPVLEALILLGASHLSPRFAR